MIVPTAIIFALTSPPDPWARMEVKQEYSKRPRLDSWSSAQQIIDQAAFHFHPHPAYSPQSQYSNSSAMAGWGDSKPRSQSMSGVGGGGRAAAAAGGGASGSGVMGVGESSIGRDGHHFSSSYAPFDSGDSHLLPVGHPQQLSVDSHGISTPVSTDAQGFGGYQSQPSDIDSGTANSSPPSQGMGRQQLKPLQTAQQAGGVFDSAAFFHQIPQGAPTEHRGSMSSGVEMASPASSNAVGPGVTAGGYHGVQGHQLLGASPVVPSPVNNNAQGGIILGGGGQGMNVVTTYPPRRKAIRAAQVRSCPPPSFSSLSLFFPSFSLSLSLSLSGFC